ncbi:MAG: DASS family sodium-coupled anion symporter [Burkholderiales bacterium]|nr:DASS family sodium-coupled anion symporter [Burkholderiales bacterium]
MTGHAAGVSIAGRWVRRAGLVGGPLAALACYFALPESHAAVLGHAGRATLAMLAWMAIWWMTEAVEIEVTALVPLVAFPLLGIASLPAAAAPYASDVIFLFLGGFVLGAAIQRWGLDRRIALATLRLVGARPERMVGGVMLATAAVSMWVSNTATAAMMLPVALSLIDLVLRRRTGRGLAEAGGLPAEDAATRNFALALLLGVAWSASIGGVGTLIGSPPNGILARFVEQTYGQEVSFARWLAIGLPVVLLMLPAAWLLLVRVVYPLRGAALEGGHELVEAHYRALGPLGPGERATLAVFVGAVLLWVTRPLLVELKVGGVAPLAGLTDAGIAIAAAMALFLIPADRGLRAMDWENARRLPWGVLVLFGGGLSLAAAVEANGVAAWLGGLAGGLGGWPPAAIVFALVAVTVFASEFTSNTAQVATMLPLVAAMAPGLGVEPQLLLVACTLAASCAFMMPVGTPPNAIVFGAGLLTIGEMMRAGFWLNAIGIVVITGLALAVIGPLLAAG